MTAPETTAPELLRPVADDVRDSTEIGRFLGWLERERGLAFGGYDALHRWAVDDLGGVWSAVAGVFGVRFRRAPERVLGRREMPGAEWFPGATLNYAEHAVGLPEDADEIAVLAYSQTRDRQELTWGELRDQVARTRAGLQRLGVGRGDRVVAYLPNIPETLVAFLATASLGAVWSSCAPEFGARSVVDRFGQIEPTVLLAGVGGPYGGEEVGPRQHGAPSPAGLPTVRHVVHVPYGANTLPDALGWDDLLAEAGDLTFDPVPFAHPLCVLFSSGTTGQPKAIVHGHGGILLEH